MELGGQISAIVGTGSAPRDGATPSPRQPPSAVIAGRFHLNSTTAIQALVSPLDAVTDNRQIGIAASQHDKKPGRETPRRGGLR